MEHRHRSSRLVVTAAIFLLLMLAFAAPVAAQEGVTYLASGQCIAEASGMDNCTANDVEYGTFTVTSVIDQCTSTSDTFTALISAEAKATAQQRDDIAFWIGLTDYAATNPDAEPGDGALYGTSCYRQILSPTTTDLNAVNVTSGEGPYASLDADNDFCGDIQQGVSTFANLPYDNTVVLTLPCADPDNDGVANVDACVSWENNRNVACGNVSQALPGTQSKCNCGSFAVPGVDIRKIIVDKVTPQYPNSAEVFSFKLDSAPASSAFTPVEFTLTDADAPFVSGPLAAGAYSVTEAAPPAGWTLETVSCVDAAGASYDPANIDLSGPAKTVTCTFTNTFEAPPDPVRKIIVDKVTKPAGSDQVFSFKLDSAPASTNFAPVQFTLTDAQAPFDSGPLAAGAYSVTEAAPPASWTLETVSCVDAAGASYDPANIKLGESAVTVTCTFTNTFEAPPGPVRKIIVDKVTPQQPNSAEVFSFKLDSVPASSAFTPVEFTLTDAQAPFVSGPLAAGVYSVKESEPPAGWTLEKATCVDAAGASYDPANIKLGESAVTVTCTFTNTFEPPDSGVPLPFSYALIGGALLGGALLVLGALMQRKARNLPS